MDAVTSHLATRPVAAWIDAPDDAEPMDDPEKWERVPVGDASPTEPTTGDAP